MMIDVKYTKIMMKLKSFQYSYSKNGQLLQLKAFQNKFKNTYQSMIILKKNIDATIYSNHWYRAPNQYKGETSKIVYYIINMLYKMYIM